MRDLVRARSAAVEVLRVHRQQVSAFMLKHGRVYPRKKGWTMRYLRWLQEQTFDHPAHQIALQEMVEAVRISKERVERLERTIEEFVPAWSLAPVVRALRTLRGVDLIVAVTFVTEVGDVSRFESPRQLMGYLGLVPGERSTGDTIRRGGITKAGNSRVRQMLVESAPGLSASAQGRDKEAVQTGAGVTARARDRMEGAEPLDGPVPNAEWTRQAANGGLHCGRPRTGRLHVGRCQGGAGKLILPLWQHETRAWAEAGPRQGNVRRMLCGRLLGRRPL